MKGVRGAVESPHIVENAHHMQLLVFGNKQMAVLGKPGNGFWFLGGEARPVGAYKSN